MKIPQKYPQFAQKNYLIVVSGAEEFVFFKISEGEILEERKVQIPKERKERQGFFVKSGRGKIFEMGAVFEPKKLKQQKQLLKELKKNIEDCLEKNREIEKIYLFVPAYLSRKVLSLLKKMTKIGVELVEKGNFLNVHPLELVELISQKIKEKRVVPISEEAKKLLEKFKFRKSR